MEVVCFPIPIQYILCFLTGGLQFLRSVGISDSHTSSKSGTSRPVKPRRLQGHPNVGDRVVLVELPPSDNSIGGLAELEVWLDEKSVIPVS